MKYKLDFIKTIMPKSRMADFYLTCLDSSVFIDFNRLENNQILLIRISFDGYGCCYLGDDAIPLNQREFDVRNLIFV